MLKFSIITLTAFVTVLVSTTRYVFKVFNKDVSRYLPLFAMAYGIILAVCGYYFTDVSFGDTIIDAIFIGLTNGASACGINQIGKQLNKETPEPDYTPDIPIEMLNQFVDSIQVPDEYIKGMDENDIDVP